MIDKKCLLSLNIDELKRFVIALDEPSFRAEQIFSWMSKGVAFEHMQNLPIQLREKLSSMAISNPVSIYEEHRSIKDGTVKFLFRLKDNNIVEGVLLRYHYGYTLCISTQVGCAMGCAFCASTIDGRIRNLSSGEMLGQIISANKHLGDKGKVGHVVLMGSGEPLDNYEKVIKFIRLLREEKGLNISARNISLSTCGIVPKIYELAREKLPVTLCISLHAPNDELRKHIMPISRLYSVDETIKAAKYYYEKTGRKIIIEYIMIKDLNDHEKQAIKLIELLKGINCHVNLIALNDVTEKDFRATSKEKMDSFLRMLIEGGLSSTIRRELGDDIEGACGQLRQKKYKSKKLKIENPITYKGRML